MFRRLILSVALLSFLSSPVSANRVGGSVAVLDIMTTAIDAKLVNIMTEILAVEVQALGVYDSVIAGRDIATMMGFERQRELVGCDHSECLVELGGALGVDRLVAGHVAKIGETYIVQIKLINITEQKTEARVYQTVKGAADLLIQTIKDSVAKLVPPDVDVNRSVANAALSPPSAPVGGKSNQVKSGAGIVPWLLVGLGLAGGGAGAFFGSQAKAHLANAEDPSFVGSQLEIAEGEGKALYANIAFGAGGAAVLTAAILWMSGGSDSAAGAQVSISPSADGATVRWEGQF
jgi:hypothetical protein